MSFKKEIESIRPARIDPIEEKRKNISCLIDVLSNEVKSSIREKAKKTPNNGIPFSCSGSICLGTTGDFTFQTIVSIEESKKKRFLDWDYAGRPLYDVYRYYSLTEDGQFVLEELRKSLKVDNIRVNEFTLSFGRHAMSDSEEIGRYVGVYRISNVFGGYYAGELPVMTKKTPGSFFFSSKNTNNCFKETFSNTMPGLWLNYVYG